MRNNLHMQCEHKQFIFWLSNIKNVCNRFILYQKCFMRLWEPIWLYKWKLPNWHQSPLGGPIMLQISPNGHEMLCGCGWGYMGKLLHLFMCGCGNMGEWESLGGIQCTKSTQNWEKSTSSAPSQLSCPHSMNGSTPEMMRVKMWLVNWSRVLIWVWMHQFD